MPSIDVNWSSWPCSCCEEPPVLMFVCSQLSAGSKMHSGDQQSPVAQEGESLAAELRRRASGHHKPYHDEAEIGREKLQGTRMRISFEQFGECRWFLLDEKSSWVICRSRFGAAFWTSGSLFHLSLVLHAFSKKAAPGWVLLLPLPLLKMMACSRPWDHVNVTAWTHAPRVLESSRLRVALGRPKWSRSWCRMYPEGCPWPLIQFRFG